MQIIFLLLLRTETATTGGLETLFSQDLFWLGLDPVFVLCISIGLSLITCVKNHTSIVSAEKGYCPMTSKILILSWGTFASLRRILSLIAFFIPSMGLFSLLHHWRAELIPFQNRIDYAKIFPILPNDKIALYGLNDTIYWSQLDRWDYTSQDQPIPPPYSSYTLLTLQQTFVALIVLSVIQFILILGVKTFTSKEFRNESHRTNKVIHVLENLNFASPFKDWDEGAQTFGEYRERCKALKREMLATFTVNLFITMLMMVPLGYCGEKCENKIRKIS